MQLGFINSVASVVLRVKLRKLSDGSSLTGLDHSSSGLIIAATADNEQGPAAGTGAGFGVAYTSAASKVETITTLGTFETPTATKCRFKAVDATNHPGLYEIQLADARWAVSNARSVNVTVSGVSDLEQVDTVIQLGMITGTDWGNGVNKTATNNLSGTTVSAVTGSTPALIWAYSSRTLTQSAASVAAAVAGSDITVYRGTKWSVSLVNIGALTGWTKLYFTVRTLEEQAEVQSQCQIKLTNPSAGSDGLLYFNGSNSVTAANGSITVDDEPTGDITISVAAATTASAQTGTYYYDVKMVTASNVTILTIGGKFTIAPDITRAVS